MNPLSALTNPNSDKISLLGQGFISAGGTHTPIDCEINMTIYN